MDDIKKRLDKEVEYRNNVLEVSLDKPDPILIAKRYKDEYISLICALFAYGKASLIVKFLDSIDYDILSLSEDEIRQNLNTYYRFQTPRDVVEFFVTIKRLRQQDSIQDIVYSGYKKEANILDGLYNIIDTINKLNDFDSQGYRFLIGNLPNKDKLVGQSPHKRWNMYLRWMVREDNIDFGLWKSIDKKDLILPLDTHTHKVSQKLGLLQRKNYDLKSAVLITQKLREFDPQDPIKYDFALYRLGQEMII